MGEGLKGALKCWAVDPTDSIQIAWNHLSGYAVIVQPGDPSEPTEPTVPKKSAWQYSAWRFAANIVSDSDNATFVDGFWVGKSEAGGDAFNVLKLAGANKVVTALGTAHPACPKGTVPIKMKQDFPVDPVTGAPLGDDYTTYTYYCVSSAKVFKADGVTRRCPYPYENKTTCDIVTGVYDACPSYLTFDFLAEPNATPGWAYNHVVFLPCKEDLRSDGDATGTFDFPTRLSFSVWNENEVKYTGTQYCAHCDGVNGQTYETYLSRLNVGKLNYFQAGTLHTSSGRFRVDGLAGGKCPGALKTPLVGVMATTIVKTTTNGNGNGGMKSIDIVGTTPSISAAATGDPGYIKWDPSLLPERRKR
jgi:hypothetical protein